MKQDELPQGWSLAELGDVIHKARPKIPADPDSHLPFIGMDHIEPGSFHLVGHSEFSKMKSAGSYFRPGDVLYGRLRPYLNKVHRAKFEGVASAEFIVLPASEHHNSDFIKYLLHQQRFIDFAMSRASGDRPRVKFDGIADFCFGLPPFDEQSRIVEKIESLFSQLDHGEASLRDVQKLLARYRQSVLKAAVTGQLTADWRAENADCLESGSDLLERILQARRENWQGRGKYTEPVAPDTSDLPELPEEWVWASFEQLFDVYGGATPSRKDSKNWNGDIPWVSSGEVAFCRIKDTEEKITKVGYQSCSTKIHPEGTILLAMIGEGKTRGQAAILDIPACNNQNAAAIRVSESGVPSEYVYYYLMGRYQESRKAGQGGNQPALNGSKVKSFAMPLPSIDEMREIAARIGEAFSTAEALATWCQTELTRSAALRQSILKDALVGKLVPQDPDDEPASELLARIRAESDAAAPKKRTRKKATA
ncbi:restriction endonuclease subunit S [Halomonas sp. DP1Y21-3]|uniref:restriction endonuclease subunit S n=1 Tax=Halomonas sp. DP1Y21-3 TaxID=2859080 RepID=UPI001C951679|nr:restriction endonuclease subunit S [Halomonas sp. DP1Y21-3]MBY6109971.1 restriction endonuclease subunit S [Halomonas sp. DP1Y21-3]